MDNDEYKVSVKIPPLIEEYVEANQKSYYVFNKYQEIMKSKDDKSDVSLSRQYRDYYEYMHNKYRYKIYTSFELLNKCTPKVFSDQLRNWTPGTNKKKSDSHSKTFALQPAEQRYLLLVGFLSKLNATEVNTLLALSGLPTLSGRSFMDCLYIYALNNNITYEDCIEKLKPKAKETMGIDVENDEKATFEMETYEDLQAYVEKNDIEELDEINLDKISVLTKEMTSSIMLLDNEEDFLEYIADNKANFLEHRESPRRLICHRILDYIEDKNLDTEKFPNCINSIWKEFLAFWGYATTTINTFDDLFKEEDSSCLFYDRGSTNKNKGYRKGEGRLLQYISGEKRIKRKMFVMLIIFLGESDIDMLDEFCSNCGFGTIRNDDNSLFNQIIIDLIDSGTLEYEDYEDAVMELLQEYMFVFSVVKTYTDMLAFDRMLFSYKDSLSEEVYSEYWDEFQSINEEFATIDRHTQGQMDLLRDLKFQLDDMINDDEIADLDKTSTRTKKNKALDRSKYIENPFYLFPNIDL